MILSPALSLTASAWFRATEQDGGVHVHLFPDEDSAEDFLRALESFSEADARPNAPRIAEWAAPEHSPFSPVASSISQKVSRLRTLHLLRQEPRRLLVVGTAASWIQPTLPAEVARGARWILSRDVDSGSRESLRLRLRDLGYVPAELVQEPGQFAFRGEILDLFPPEREHPVRIGFFDTIPESIRAFHPETQRTLREAGEESQIEIGPAEELLFPWTQPGPVLERIKEFCDRNQISRKVRDPIFENVRNGFMPDHYRTWIPFVHSRSGRLLEHLPEAARIHVHRPDEFRAAAEQHLAWLRSEESRYEEPHWITPGYDLLYSDAALSVEAALKKSLPPPDAPSEVLDQGRVQESEILEWLEDGLSVWIGSRGPSHQERIRHHLIQATAHTGLRLLASDPGESRQFWLQRTIILSERSIFGTDLGAEGKRGAPARHPKFEAQPGLAFRRLEDLSVGDLVVHALHGVGRYLGLFELKSGDRPPGEYLLIEYSGGDKLYLPVYRLNNIQRHATGEGAAALDRLGSGQFEKAKQKARDSAKKLALNLVELYAKRSLLQGRRFDPPGDDYYQFCERFEFQETEGQMNAVGDILRDLESGRLLDRLVCGDVGFGKTEVAIRAAFQAVQNGTQVAVLVPTTLLAFQHEQSFRSRMKDFAIRIESISRFKTRKIQNDTLRDLKDGKIDILIGTHRLLSKDVAWANLGLLIVDEEHRFGVEHKEKIKAIQTDTHTLTLTATPIPRTLNMALSGLKEISVIQSPPTNRQPIKTHVSSWSPELVKTAIETELARGGQVFYLHNKVQSIQHHANEIQRLVPSAKVIIAHGQMSESEIEERMLAFYKGQAQVLVCTTIIESGIDIPNAGTILIDRADQLGLAQLYQIRGRVGRSHRRAHAYLLVHDEETLTGDARQRLDALQRFVELGSGFQIASLDLEIRGGGNVLGGEQSGHIAAIGLDLYTEILEEAIQELRGKPLDTEERRFEPELQVPVVCEIRPSLIPDARLRLSLYRRISNADTEARISAIEEELGDRFGELPAETVNLFWLIRLKALLKRAGIDALSAGKEQVSLTVRKTTLVDPGEAMKLAAGPKGIRDPRVRITPDSKIVFQAPFTGIKPLVFEMEALLRRVAPKAFENASGA
jgi:transcription-repair coupling factor (superfamily II helicase)